MAPPIPDPRKRYLGPNRSNGVKHKVVNSKSELGKVHMKPSSDRSNHGLGVVAVHSPAQEVLRTSGPSVTRMNSSDFTSARLHPDRLSSRVQEEIWTIRPSNGWPISAHESCCVKYSHHGRGGVSDLKNMDNTGAYPSIRETSVTVGKSLGRTTTGRRESVDNRGGRSAGSTNTRGDVSFGNTNIEAGKSFKGRTIDGLDSQQTVVTHTQKYEEYRRLCFNIGDRYNRWFLNLEYGHQKRCKGNNCEHNNGGESPLVAVARILGWCFDWVGGK